MFWPKTMRDSAILTRNTRGLQVVADFLFGIFVPVGKIWWFFINIPGISNLSWFKFPEQRFLNYKSVNQNQNHAHRHIRQASPKNREARIDGWATFFSFIHLLPTGIFIFQRREYKSKFLDMDTEYSRLKERMENMNHMLDDIQVFRKNSDFWTYLELPRQRT